MVEPLAFFLAALTLLAAPGPTNTLLAMSGAAAGLRPSLPLIGAALGGYLVSVLTLGLVLGPVAKGNPVVALALSVVTFPLLLDRDTDLDVAIGTSLRVVRENPGTMALWGLIVAGLLVLGSLPALLGLIVVLPVLGHASWRLYRRAVAPV